MAVIGLDSEAIQNKASVRIGFLARDVGIADRFQAEHLVLVGHQRDRARQRVAVDERLQSWRRWLETSPATVFVPRRGSRQWERRRATGRKPVPEGTCFLSWVDA